MSDYTNNDQRNLPEDEQDTSMSPETSAESSEDAAKKMIAQDVPEQVDTEEKMTDAEPAMSVSEETYEEINWTPQKKRGAWMKDAVDYMEIFVFAICFVIFIFSFGFRLCTVEGASMEQTLYEGESLIVSDLFYTPEREDIIVFHQTGTLNEPVVKRVIATEGETVRLDYEKDSMTVTIINEAGATVLTESYMYYNPNGPLSPAAGTSETYVVGEGQLFVMGDNRTNSKDSRSADISLVDTRRVLGKVVFRITPFSKFGSVK